MELIKKLGMIIVKENKKAGEQNSGLFLCPTCKVEVIRPIQAGSHVLRS